MNDKAKTQDKRDELTDAELDKVAGGGPLAGDTGGVDPRGPARTTEGDPRKRALRNLLDR